MRTLKKQVPSSRGLRQSVVVQSAGYNEGSRFPIQLDRPPYRYLGTVTNFSAKAK